MDELDVFSQLELAGSSSKFPVSNIYSVRQGGFGLDPRLKTYLTTLNVSELEQDVTFYEQLSKDKDWPISQIIQREVDQDRVNVISTKYLLGEGRQVKYFPPIIVALLPRDKDGNFAGDFQKSPDLTSESRETIFEKSKYRNNEKFKEILFSKNNQSSVDGIYLFNTSQVFEHNLFCWDKTKIFAVVIDGQHRLESLIRANKQNPAFEMALQDVIFLDASVVTSEVKMTPVEVLRTVFIDINTNAKSVGIVRRILMDDKDLASLCVQSMVESISKDGSAKENEYFLNPVLVDWDGTSSKHELPHVTGVLTLYQMLSDELVTDRLVSVDDLRNQRKIKGFIDLLNGYFFVDKRIESEREFARITKLETSFNEYLRNSSIENLDGFSQLIAEDVTSTVLFNYDYRVLEVAQDTFEKLYVRSLVTIYNRFQPFEEAINELVKVGAFDQNSNLNRALIFSKLKVSGQIKDTFLQVRRQMIDQLAPRNFIFYTVVGQKSIFKLFFDRVFEKFEHGMNEDKIVRISEQLLSDFNVMISKLDKTGVWLFGKDDVVVGQDSALEEYGTVATSFWEGILYEDKRIIYNSQGVRALADVITLILLILSTELNEDSQEFSDFTIRFANLRTKRLLRKRFGERPESEFNEIATQIINSKKRFLLHLVNESKA